MAIPLAVERVHGYIIPPRGLSVKRHLFRVEIAFEEVDGEIFLTMRSDRL